MARSQPYTVACAGGLVTSSNAIDLLKTPGVATELKNFEVSTKGGYRRINGFTKFGAGSAVQPTGGTATILGAIPYADGVVVCAGTSIYFSQTGTSWLEINRASVASSGDNYTAFTGRSVAARTGQGQCQFALFESATSDYGTLIISDGANEPFFFRMEGTGANVNTRTFFAGEITVTSTKSVEYVTVHDKHLIAAGVAERILVQVSYAIGVAEPTSISVNTFGTSTIDESKIADLVREHFDLRPSQLIKMLDLKRPIYQATAAYGHFGREESAFTWEKTDKAEALKG